MRQFHKFFLETTSNEDDNLQMSQSIEMKSHNNVYYFVLGYACARYNIFILELFI